MTNLGKNISTEAGGMDSPGNATLRSGKSANREIGVPRMGWEIKTLDTESADILNSILGLI
ncbi:MAG: hypothetical protein WCI51_16910 [Lentisphaerota bacterium]